MLRRLREMALGLPVVITVNDCVVSVARADAADLPGFVSETDGSYDLTREVPSRAQSSSGDTAYVLLDRTATRLLNFTRGDMVYLKTPADPGRSAVRRLVALEGDWVTVGDSDDVQKIPKGHCRLERVDVVSGRRGLGRNSVGTWHTGNTGTKWRGAGGVTDVGSGDGGGKRDATQTGDEFHVVPVALLEAKLAAVLWPPSLFGLIKKEIPQGRVLITDDGTE